MTKDDVIRMAREAGLAPICSACDEPDVSYAYEDWDEELEKFAALVAEQERQACARVVMSFKNWSRVDLLPISEAIKSRRLEFRSNP
jgi:hypothetical protein